MQYKAIILDLDGTTVPSKLDGMPSTRVNKAIAKLKNKLAVCVATGRPLFSAKPILDHIQITGPCILNNGTIIYNPTQKLIMQEVILPNELLPQIRAICAEFNAKPYVFDGIKEVVYDPQKGPEKALSMFVPGLKEEVADRLMDSISKLPTTTAHKMISHTKDRYDIEITHADASKLHGIKEVAKMLNISTHEIIGVGDGYNDFPLLMACGLKFAMGNAVPELKSIADFVAPSVDRDGVAVIIEKFVLPLLA